jgi:mono/diheme cytochrome c family protein
MVRSLRMKLPSLSLASVFVAAPVFAAPADYLRDVKPIFAEHCYRCHGASQQKSGLRMDTAAFALKGGENGPAFKAGKSADSLLVQAVKGTHPDVSPMPYKKPPLTSAQIGLIEQWIDQGAKAPADEQPEKNVHWAFVPPARPLVPRLPTPASRLTNPIDHFILAWLEKEGIQPSPEADRVTLIRRLSLDLTGLPPGIADVDAFVNDLRPDAYERLVERLLASPHFGERWGRLWLDAARYGDSNGYSIDAPRSIWKYRDWVIDALNRDLPFDQFTIEQLAGDLLPNATLQQKIATGFNRNTQINQEGGIDPEQFRVESVMDRVNTTATVFLGVTLACAQCHDHKFDPFTQREYYQFYAFFNNTIEDGHGKSAPEGMLEIPGETEATENLQKELEETEADLDRFLDTKGSEIVKWEESLTAEEATVFKPEVRALLRIPFAELTRQQKRIVYAVFRADDPEFKQRNTKLTKLEKRQPKPVTTLVMMERPEPRESFVFIKGDFTRKGDAVTPGVPAVLHPLFTDSSGSARGPRADFGGPPKSSSDGASENVFGGRPNPASTNSQILDHPHPGRLPQERENPSSVSRGSQAVPTTPGSESSANARLSSPLPGGEGRGEGEPTASADSNEKVSKPGSPSLQPNRLDLAKWIVDPKNPLTSRVIVNRIWQQYFGRGLVATENDFGTQGSLPTHPELLDWLACELTQPGSPDGSPHPAGEGLVPRPKERERVAEGRVRVEGAKPTVAGEGGRNPSRSAKSSPTIRPWSLKHLHRLIVNSATYRQSSRARPDLDTVDPNNRFLARQSRLRLDAEIVRDVCLSASGLFNDRIGGPGVFPPQPDGVMNLGQSKRDWKPSVGQDRYRRGLYTFFWRATPNPALMVFDSADGFSACTRRLRSNTPLQALTLLNDEAFYEFAEALASRVLKEGPDSDVARLDFVFRLCLSRAPSPDEKQRLLELLNKEFPSVQKSSNDIVPLSRKSDSKSDIRRLAAWTTISRVLLNLDETITRE